MTEFDVFHQLSPHTQDQFCCSLTLNLFQHPFPPVPLFAFPLSWTGRHFIRLDKYYYCTATSARHWKQAFTFILSLRARLPSPAYSDFERVYTN